MANKLYKAQRLREIDKLISFGLKPKEIQEQLGISEVTYYRDVKELCNKMYTEEAIAQHDKDIDARWNKLDRILAIDLDKTKDNPSIRSKVLNNAIKLNKERLDYYLKTGKIRERTKKEDITINYSKDTLKELDIINKYITKSDKDK